jgi:polysaccharide biosynthesis/export protein
MKIKTFNFLKPNFNLISLFLLINLNLVFPAQARNGIPTFSDGETVNTEDLENIPIQSPSMDSIPMEDSPNNQNNQNNQNTPYLQNIPLQTTPYLQNTEIPNNPIQPLAPQTIPLQYNPVKVTGLPLSPGDLIKITIPGIGGEAFTGDYEVNLYGYLEIPFIDPLFAVGLNAQQIKEQLTKILLEKQFFKPELLRLSVQVLQFSPIQVTVTGEVFSPGRITINTKGETAITVSNPAIPGDNPLERYLTTALKTVGGVKPTADVENIQIFRNGQLYQTVSLTGLFQAQPVEDIPLIAGDYIVVSEAQNFQNKLVRPSPITPDQISLYISNLSDPGSGRAVSISAETQNTSFAYGTRFSQALISAQCVGGNFRNENRRVLLIRTDSDTGESEAHQYSIGQILDPNNNNEQVNPFVMPNDSIVCYDSELVSTETLFNLIGTFLNPLNLINGIFNIFR